MAVAREGSISGGARRLLVTQQSLSATVAQVERRLGVRLFTRTSRGVEPTAAGRALLDRAPAVLAALDAAVTAARAAGDDGEGSLTLRFGLDTEPFVEPVLAAFRAAHPAVAPWPARPSSCSRARRPPRCGTTSSAPSGPQAGR